MELRDRLQSALGSAYLLERELGGGGMSRVFVAEERSLGRQVVVKVLHPELAGGGMSVDRFRREIQLAARLQHPHIVPVLSSGEVDGIPFFTMPFVAGESLRARLSRGGELAVAESIDLLRELAKALAYAHEQGVVHRDIKPENILLSGNAVMVTDFGVAKALAAASGSKRPEDDSPRDLSTGGLTSLGLALGTPAYMAPEQAAADPAVDHRADLYALGVVAYEMLSGQPPFHGRPAQALAAAHMTEHPEELARRRPRIPAPLSALVMRLLEKRPADRPQSAAEVLHALDEVQTPSSAVMERVGSPALGTTTRRARQMWAAGAGALALVTLAGAWVVLRAHPSKTDAEVIAIAPFRVTAAGASLQYLREGMVDLLAAKLGGTQGVRAADPRTVLAAWRGGGDLPQDEAVRIATRVGAGQLMLGEVVGSGTRLSITAKLIAVASGKELATAHSEGSSDSLPALLDHLAANLLSLGAGEDARRLTELTSTSLPALREYLEGQSRFRGAQYGDAMRAYLRAVELDSTFALAGIGLVRAGAWGGGTPAERARGDAIGRRVAWRERDRLSVPDRTLVELYLGANFPQPPTWAEYLAMAERLAALRPESPEGWFEIGDALYHGGAVQGLADAPERALRAFSRALAIDSLYIPALTHMPALYQQLEDTAGQRRASERLLAHDSTTELSDYHRWQLAVARRDTTGLRAVRARMKQSADASLREISAGALISGRQVDDAMRVQDELTARALTEDERLRGAYLGYVTLIELGRPLEAASVVSRLGNPLLQQFLRADYALNATIADGDSALGAAATREMAKRLEGSRDTASRGGPRNDAFALAQHDLALGDAAAARRVIATMRAYVPPADTAWLGKSPRQIALLLDAQIAARERRADAPALLAQLDSALLETVGHDLFTSVGNLVAARLWDERGDTRRALAAVRRRELGVNYVPFAAVYLREQGRLAALAGDRELAIRSYRHFLALRANPEPALVKDAERVRAELAKLERASVGR